MLSVSQTGEIALATIYPQSNGIIKWNQMFCIIAVYILLSYSVLESKTDPTCTPCIHMTRSGQGVTWTLLHHTHFPCQGEAQETCVHTRQPILFVNKKANTLVLTTRSPPNEDWLEVRHQEGGLLINQTWITNLEFLASVHFDVCAAINRNPWNTIKCGAYHGTGVCV